MAKTPESLEAYQLAKSLAIELYKSSTRHWHPTYASAWDQARRAALSIPLNLAEGFAWGTGGRWRFHLRVANGSAMETLVTVRILGELGALPREEAIRLEEQANATKRKVWALLCSRLNSA